MKEKNPVSKEILSKLQAKIKEYIPRYEKLRGFL